MDPKLLVSILIGVAALVFWWTFTEIRDRCYYQRRCEELEEKRKEADARADRYFRRLMRITNVAAGTEDEEG